MFLSQQQKEWIVKITTGEIKNFLDFADDSKYYRDETKRWLVTPDNQYEFKRYLYNFLGLINKLEAKNLVFLAGKGDEANFGNLVYGNEEQEYIDEYLNQLMSKYGTIEIIPFEELNTFVKNDYLTEEEIALKKEIRDRKISQFLTVIVALASIIFSAISC